METVSKVNTSLQLFEKFNMGSYLVGEGFLTNEMMFVVYDDHDHGSRLTRENEIQPPSESFCTLLGKT